MLMMLPVWHVSFTATIVNDGGTEDRAVTMRVPDNELVAFVEVLRFNQCDSISFNRESIGYETVVGEGPR
jgi:hypothetical protein